MAAMTVDVKDLMVGFPILYLLSLMMRFDSEETLQVLGVFAVFIGGMEVIYGVFVRIMNWLTGM